MDEQQNGRPKEVDQDQYKRGIAQITSSHSSAPTAHATPAKPDALQPVSALGAFPLVRSTQASQLPLIVKGVYQQAALFTVTWAALTIAFLPTIRALIVVATGALLITFLFHHSIVKLKSYQDEEESARFEARSEAIQKSGLPESVEWLNGLIEGIWPRIPADMFSSVADMLEDTIQANLPTFLTEVKCAELTQGKNALRVLSSRLLPPTEEDEEEARWNGGVKKHIQLELAFAYRAMAKRRGISRPTKENSRGIESNGDLADSTTHGRQDARIRFLFQAKLGPIAMQLPVEVVLNGLVGIAHIRLELTNSSPFLGDMDISFVGLPRVSLDVVPLKLSLAEVPGLSGVIQSSVDSALEMYTMPKKLSMNLGELLMGDGIKRDCDACGILLITIHSARGLERSDIKGSGDPYARVNYSRTSTASSRVTRVIKNELNPVWEQTFSLVVSPQVLAALDSTGADEDDEEGESIEVEIFDSDTTFDDDFLGKARWSLKKVIGEANAGKMVRRQDSLSGQGEKGKHGGTVDWSVGFFSKRALQGEEEQIKTETDKLDKPTQQDKDRIKKEQQALLIEKQPPTQDPSLGILAIQIHGITSLRYKDADSEEVFQEAPSSYAEVLLADRLVFRSRTKMDDGEPCFNAMTEQVCDWRASSCVIVVRENKTAGKDPILGVVPIQLSRIFDKACLVTDVYPMAGGIASGRLHLSLLFRSVQLPTSTPRLHAPVGLLAIRSLEVHTLSKESIHHLESTSIKFSAVSAKSNIPIDCIRKKDEQSVEWELTKPSILPIYRRDAIALIIKLRSKRTNLLRGGKTAAFGVMWLNQIEDEKGVKEDQTSQTFELPLWDASSSKTTRKQVERNWSSISERDEAKVGLKLMGTIKIGVNFYTGVTRFHRQASQLAGDSSQVYETWCAIRDAGLASHSKAFDDIPSDVQTSSDESDDSSPITSKTKRLPLQESGSHGQLLNRLARKGDEQTISVKDEVRSNISRIKNKFRTDNDKSTGVETEV